jgi:hypothetical protein
MIYQLSIALLLMSGLLFIMFTLIDYAIFQESECKHDCHKKVCGDCGKEFQIKEKL